MFYKEDVAMAIVVFDDELESPTILRQMVDGLFSQEMNYDIIEINDLSSLARFLKDGNRVDILVTDIVMPESSVDGIEVVKRLFPAESGTQILVSRRRVKEVPRALLERISGRSQARG